jgi:hypothetical protein
VETLLGVSSAGDVVCVDGAVVTGVTSAQHQPPRNGVLSFGTLQIQNYLALYPRLGVNVTRLLAVQHNKLE